MAKHPIVVALETADFEAMSSALNEDVVLYSLVLGSSADEVKGRELTLQILGTAMHGLGLPTNVTEFEGSDGRYIAAFETQIQGHPISVQLTFKENSDGEVVSIAPHMRPWPGVQRFRDHMKNHMCPDPVPESSWELATLA